MNDTRNTHGLWAASAPPAPPQPTLENDVQVDVVIVGAGFTGLSCALHLQKQGATTVVLDAQTVGFGGSGRNVGLVNAGMWVMPSALPGELGDLYGQRLLKQLGNGPDLVYDLIAQYGIECEAVRNGTLHCAVGASGLNNIAQRAREWEAQGAPVHLLDAQETAKRTGTNAYTGSLLDLRAGTVQPLAYARGLAHAAHKEGAKLYGNTKVISAHDAGSHWNVKTNTGAVVKAKWVVVATNAFTDCDGAWAKVMCELVRLPYFNMATKPLPERVLEKILPGLEGVWDTPDILTSFRRDKAGRLVFGSVGALRGAGSKIHHDWGRRAMGKLFPELRDYDFEYEWYGWIGMTDNSLPRFHELARNTFAFSGYNGRGIATGSVFGRELARLISGEIQKDDLALPVSGITPTHCKKTKEAYYEVGAQAAHFVGARF